MALVSQGVPNLVNGVSQQPSTIRRLSQAELQENCYSSVSDGLTRRAPTKHIARLKTGTLADAFHHTINRDQAERYNVIITDGAVEVYDLTGAQRTVATPNGTSYLTATTPSTSFRAVTIADYTFIVNTSQTVAMSAARSPINASEGLVFMKQAINSCVYSVFVDGTERGTYTAPASGAVNTSTGMEDIKTDLEASLGVGWTITRNGAVVRIVKDDGTDFTLEARDTQSGTAIEAFKTKAQRFSDLPTVAPNGFTLEVVGDNTSNFDNYYVKFETSDEGLTFAEGVWRETVKPDILIQFDAATMPHTLVREGDGTFTFAQAVWGDRSVGDEDSAPDPTFVGSMINDILFFKNRLGFLADENVILSRASEFFEFFPSTVTTVLDSDPIDVASSNNKVSILRHAIPFNEQLLVFSDLTQFIFSGGDILTPKTAAMDPTTEFASSIIAKPVNAGQNVFFSVDKGQFDAVREYFVDADTDINDAAEVTAHIPRYVPSGVFKLTAATNEDVMVALTSAERSSVFVYKYYWSGNEKLQSSWSKWTFNGASVLNTEFIDSVLYLVLQRSDGIYLESMNVTSGEKDPGATYLTHLDRRIDDTQCSLVSYDVGTNKTTWTLPYDVNAGAAYQVATRFVEGSGVVEGVVLQGVAATGNTVEATGDQTSTPVWIGEDYESAYTFSTQHVRDSQQDGAAAVLGTRLQLLFWTLTHDRTGFYSVHVNHEHRTEESVYPFTGRIVGSASNKLGQVSLESGTFKFPVLGKNEDTVITVRSRSILPFSILSAEWEADFTPRTRRI